MIPNNNTSVLPFHTALEQQSHRRSYAYGAIYPIYVPQNMLVPFQIVRNTRTNTAISSVLLYDTNDTFIEDITQQMVEAGLMVKRYASYGYDVIIFPAIVPMSCLDMVGQYFIRVYDGVNRFYSDVFTVVDNIDDYLKIQWYCEEDVYYKGGVIHYTEPKFINTLYLDTQLGKPEYPFTEESEERDGLLFPVKMYTEKTYKFTALASEPMCDCMRLIRMADYVQITDPYGNKYDADQFLCTPSWQTQGDVASVECEFQTATIFKNIGRGVRILDNGDFNIDFNNDYSVRYWIMCELYISTTDNLYLIYYLVCLFL